MSNWCDRYSSEVVVYGLGQKPVELEKKFNVDMYKYEIGVPRKPEYKLSQTARNKILQT